MSDVIKFYKGDENKTVLETQDYEDSIFKEQYAQALSIFERICKDQEAFKSDGTFDKLYDNSNIIAFCGDRGEGKTSCLRTVRHLLSTGTKEDDRNKVRTLSFSSDTTPFPCYLLDMVDPAFFDKKHNLIELILGQMYGKVVKDDIEKNENIEKCRRKELMIRFQKAKQCLAYLEKERKELYDDLEELSVLAASTELRKEIANLFEEFCRYTKSKKLIIAIDDLDLNMKNGYNMAEEMRKYLCNEYCVLLVALKVEQLVELTQLNIASEMKCKETDEFKDMAVKAVAKLLPYSNRVQMPRIEDLCEKKIQILSERQTVSKTQAVVDAKQELPLIKDLVLTKIYEKTRFLFYNSKGKTSYIIPRNLRALRHLIATLDSMPEIEEKDQKNTKAFLHNKSIFKDYLFTEWSKGLDPKYIDFIHELVEYPEYLTINKFVVSSLHEWCKDYVDKLAINITDPRNASYNVSEGDVMYYIHQVEKKTANPELLKLLFFIRSFYSIRLFECYDAITDVSNSDNLFPKSQQGGIYKSDVWFDEANALQKLVNGSYFTFAEREIMPFTKDVERRDVRLVDASKLRELYKSIMEGLDSIEKKNKTAEEGQENNSNEHKMNNNGTIEIAEDTKQAFRRLEYFALTSLWKANYGDTGINRMEINPYYLTPFNSNMGYIGFDVLAPLATVINLKYTYNRYSEFVSSAKAEDKGNERTKKDSTLWTYATKYSWSLLSWMLNAQREEEFCEPECKECSISTKHIQEKMSLMTIRNAEIQSSLAELLLRNGQSDKDGSSTIDKIKRIYTLLSGSVMVTQFEDDTSLAFLKAMVHFMEKEAKYSNANASEGELLSKSLDYYFVPIKRLTDEEKKKELKTWYPKTMKSSATTKRTIIKNILSENSLLEKDKLAEMFTEDKYDKKDKWMSIILNNFDLFKKQD